MSLRSSVLLSRLSRTANSWRNSLLLNFLLLYRLYDGSKTDKFFMSGCFTNKNGIQYIKDVNIVFCHQCGHCSKFSVPDSTAVSLAPLTTSPSLAMREHEEFRSAEKVPGDIYGTPWGNSFRMTQGLSVREWKVLGIILQPSPRVVEFWGHHVKTIITVSPLISCTFKANFIFCSLCIGGFPSI